MRHCSSTICKYQTLVFMQEQKKQILFQSPPSQGKLIDYILEPEQFVIISSDKHEFKPKISHGSAHTLMQISPFAAATLYTHMQSAVTWLGWAWRCGGVRLFFWTGIREEDTLALPQPFSPPATGPEQPGEDGRTQQKQVSLWDVDTL